MTRNTCTSTSTRRRWPSSCRPGSRASSTRNRSKKLVRAVIEEAGFPAEDTHYDLPKPRTSFPVGHLTTGVAFAFPWHRDAWYSAPAQQINWWLPIFPVREDNAMSFDLASFDRAVPNTSDAFDYYQNNASRLTTATGVTREVQARPGAVDHQPDQELVVLPAPWPGPAVLRSAASRLDPEHVRAGQVQRRLPDGLRARPDGRPRRPAGGRSTAPAPRYATSSTSPTSGPSTSRRWSSFSARRRPMRCWCSAAPTRRTRARLAPADAGERSARVAFTRSHPPLRALGRACPAGIAVQPNPPRMIFSRRTATAPAAKGRYAPISCW